MEHVTSTAESVRHQNPAAPARPGRVLLLLCLAQFLVVTNITLVAILLPMIQRDLGFGGADLHWIVTSYTLMFGCTLLLAGRLVDRFGDRAVFATGLGLFGAASLACGLAGDAAVLLVARALQGLGGAAVAAAGLALLMASFPGTRERSGALGWWAGAQACGGATGWLAGGVLGDLVGWQWVFLLNVPLAAVCAVLTPVVLRHSTRGGVPGMDAVGAVFATVGLFLLVFGLTRFGEASGHLSGGLAVAAGVLVLAGFVLVERRAADPLVPAAVVGLRSLRRGVLVVGMSTAVTTPVLTLSVLYLREVAGLSASVSGVLFVPFNLAVIVGSFVAVRLLARHEHARNVVMSAAMAGIGAGALVLVFLPVTGTFLAPLLAGFVLMGVGGGAASVAANTEGTSSVPAEHRGAASGLLNTANEIGVVLGNAVLITAAFSVTAILGHGGAEQVSGYRVAFAGGAAVALAVTAFLLVTRASGHRRPDRVAGSPARPASSAPAGSSSR